MSIYLSTAYLPPISYFVAIQNGQETFIEQHENYIKQTYRNRCNIFTTNGRMALSIPIEKNINPKTNIRNIKIAQHDNWQRQHWRSIKAAYQSSPFFEYYEEDFAPFYERKHHYLWEYNYELLQLILQLLDIDTKISLTQKYIEEYNLESDLRERIHPKKDTIIKAETYYQTFENKYPFQTDLSIIDLLFNMGNESILILNQTKLLI